MKAYVRHMKVVTIVYSPNRRLTSVLPTLVAMVLEHEATFEPDYT